MRHYTPPLATLSTPLLLRLCMTDDRSSHGSGNMLPFQPLRSTKPCEMPKEPTPAAPCAPLVPTAPARPLAIQPPCHPATRCRLALSPHTQPATQCDTANEPTAAALPVPCCPNSRCCDPEIPYVLLLQAVSPLNPPRHVTPQEFPQLLPFPNPTLLRERESSYMWVQSPSQMV
jgi:hypothetical protein